jgi:hypothetical protein
MKTPMQEMLEWVRATLPMDLDWPIMIEQKVKSLLEKEKEVIMDAYEAGSHTEWDENTWMLVEKREYYNETFNTNEK